jgi:hypothetical protein
VPPIKQQETEAAAHAGIGEDAALVPLEQAAHTAYTRISSKDLVGDGADRETAVGLAAMALSMVAPVYEKLDGAAELKPLNAHAVNERLFRRVREGKVQRRKGLFMRADDLWNAIELLKTAHTSFRPEGLRFGKDRERGD